MRFSLPELKDLLSQIGGVQAQLKGVSRSIEEWRVAYRKELPVARRQPAIGTFNRFVNNLLERAMPGEAWVRRAEATQRVFISFEDVTKGNAARVLKEAGYRFPSEGISVILSAKELATADGFSWAGYIEEAEQHYESDFQDDPFLKIKGVSFKTRDLALSEFSDRFVAVDLHVVRVTSRTGLLLHGYGDPRIAADVSKEPGYLFFHDLILKLSRQTGWPAAGYSPGEIDRMLWNFGRAVCSARPRCSDCPLVNRCLTSVARAR